MPSLKKSILFIDDNLETLFLLNELYDRDYSVSTAKNGPEANLIIEKSHFDAAIVDLKLADGECGYQVAQALKQKYPNLLVIIMTGFGLDYVYEKHGRDFHVLSKLVLVVADDQPKFFELENVSLVK